MSYADLPQTGIVTAAGTLKLVLKPQGRQTWTVSQVSNSMVNAPVGALCYVKKLGVIVSPLVPNSDAASGFPAVQVRYTENMSVEWSGCTPGDIGQVLWVYDDGQQG